MLLLETTPTMADKLSETLRELMAKRNLDGIDVANAIGISQTALSQILTDKSKPRSKTFIRLRDLLAQNLEERAMLTAAYEGRDYTQESGEFAVEEEPEETLPRDIVDRSAQYLDAKAQSIEFRNDIERILQDARIPVIRDYVFYDMTRKVACDFVTKSSKNRIVIEAKFNLNRDWDHVLGTSLLVRRKMPAHGVVVVVPYHNPISLEAKKDFAHDNIPVVTIAELVETLRKMGA
jgi:transcriptional regulator with XRE-family HTH domain